MTIEQQALLDIPIWLVIVLALVGGLSGEMWRADKDGARGWSLLRRLALRSGACMVCGVFGHHAAVRRRHVDLGCGQPLVASRRWPGQTWQSGFMSVGQPGGSGLTTGVRPVILAPTNSESLRYSEVERWNVR
jgi:hypothetical protein